MKRSIALLTIAAAALFLVFASSTPVALAQNGHRIIVPDSSIERPGDAGVRAHTNITLVLPGKVEIGDNGAPIAENPLSLACIYHLVKQTKGCPKTSKVVPTGGTKAIALVDAFDNPDAVNDLKTFAAAYGYGTPNFTVVKVGNPPPNSGWALEESLDIEYAFGMAPNAQIYLVEANSNSDTDLDAAEDKATELLQGAGGGCLDGPAQVQGGPPWKDSHDPGQVVGAKVAVTGPDGGPEPVAVKIVEAVQAPDPS